MEKNIKKPADAYPGVDTDKADNDKVNPGLVKEDVRDLNNNPRNNDIDK